MENKFMENVITKCRVCGNENLEVILDLGVQYLSGVFPKNKDMEEKSSLVLVKCSEDHSDSNISPCGHIQLQSTYDPGVMYGDNYGYRSGLNKSMVEHLRSRVEWIKNKITLNDNDIVLDIAGNDGTLLGCYPKNIRRINIDPTSEKFSRFSPDGVEWINDFFSKEVFIKKVGEDRKAKVITAFSMFYDLEDPVKFASDVKEILDIDGILILEQSYAPMMYHKNSYDTICHEHLSYYGVRQIKYILEKAGLKIINLEWNDCNGGSCVVTAAQMESNFEQCTLEVDQVIDTEISYGIYDNKMWEVFNQNIKETKAQLLNIISGKRVAALGASTKGNVLLQYCGIGPDKIEVIGDVNPDKNGCLTPGTWIPIVDEDTVLNGNYDLYVVLPWHFRDFFVNNPKFKGKTLVFPLPTPEVVTVN